MRPESWMDEEPRQPSKKEIVAQAREEINVYRARIVDLENQITRCEQQIIARNAVIRSNGG